MSDRDVEARPGDNNRLGGEDRNGESAGGEDRNGAQYQGDDQRTEFEDESIERQAESRPLVVPPRADVTRTDQARRRSAKTPPGPRP